MLRSKSMFVLCALAAVCLLACGDDGGGVTPDVDAAPLPIDAANGCEPATLLPTQWRPIAAVSAGAVAVTAAGGVTSGTIDATAGGTAASADNPYLYLDLVTGAKLELSDLAALSSTAWHVALKRSSLKLNSGDSGPGQVTAASVAAATLAEVTTVPASLAADDWATSDCMLTTTPGGEPASVMGSWYDYDDATHRLTPKAEVWVLKLGDGASAPVRKLRIVTYYGDTAMPMRGAFYRVEWAAL